MIAIYPADRRPRIDLTLVATIGPVSIDIRAQHDADADAVADVITRAFADGGHVAGLAAALRTRPDKQAGLVAVEDGRIVGHTQLSVSWVDARRALVEVLTLSPLSVVPDRQRRGIGTLLLDRARDAGEELDVPLLFLEGDPGYYAGRGWQSAADLGFTPPSDRIPLPACQVMPLTGYDAAWMQGALVYNDTFWAHDSVGLRGD